MAISCGHDFKKASKANFKAAIQDALNKQPACIIASIPEEIPDFKGRHHADSQLDALVSVGLVKKIAETVAPSPMDWAPGEPRRKVPGVRYDLTDKGRQYVRRGKVANLSGLAGPMQSLCFAEKKVVDVIGYTEPAQAMGVTLSEVTYSYTLTNVADWARSHDVEEQFFTGKQIDPGTRPLEGKVELVLMNDGWRVPERF